MASIYWDMEHYSAVEKIFRQSAEFCSEHEVWKLNVAHTFFMQVRVAWAGVVAVSAYPAGENAALHRDALVCPACIGREPASSPAIKSVCRRV